MTGFFVKGHEFIMLCVFTLMSILYRVTWPLYHDIAVFVSTVCGRSVISWPLYVCRCMCMFIVSHATVCFCMCLVGYPQTPEPVIPPGRLTQIDLSCVDVP